MSKLWLEACWGLPVLRIPAPPPFVKINIKEINQIMEEKRKHPATVAEMALRNIKPDTPLHELMDVVKDALETYGYKDEPKEEQQSVKEFYEDGEICVCRQGVRELYIFINRGKLPVKEHYDNRNIDKYAHLERTNVITIPYAVFAKDGLLFIPGGSFYVRSATPEEKQLLLDELENAGYQWDEEHKKVVKQRWKPGPRETYYRPFSSGTDPAPFLTSGCVWMNYEIDQKTYGLGWVFQTKEECDAFCQKLNEAIQNVKRE